MRPEEPAPDGGAVAGPALPLQSLFEIDNAAPRELVDEASLGPPAPSGGANPVARGMLFTIL
jgi:hypothetical protein